MFENVTVPKIEIGINQWMGVLIRTRLEILRIRELSKNQNETHIKIMSKNVTAHCV